MWCWDRGVAGEFFFLDGTGCFSRGGGGARQSWRCRCCRHREKEKERRRRRRRGEERRRRRKRRRGWEIWRARQLPNSSVFLHSPCFDSARGECSSFFFFGEALHVSFFLFALIGPLLPLSSLEVGRARASESACRSAPLARRSLTSLSVCLSE